MTFTNTRCNFRISETAYSAISSAEYVAASIFFFCNRKNLEKNINKYVKKIIVTSE